MLIVYREKYPQRERTYGLWHRLRSIARFIGDGEARSLCMLDLDSVLFTEYDHQGMVPLCLVEVARDVGQQKPAGIIRKLAELADLPAYVALYEPSFEANPASPDWPDIDSFRVQRIWPRPDGAWRELKPDEWARALVRIRAWQMRRFEARAAANDDHFEAPAAQMELFG